MAEKCLLSTAYFPPVHYMMLIASSDKVLIEKEENYTKQTYRNRCYILSPHGPLTLTVPVLAGSHLKMPLKDKRIDYSRRWQQIHLRGISSSYRSSAYYLYYSDRIEKVINRNHKFLLDLNREALETVIGITGLTTPVIYTSVFELIERQPYDFRYNITPKNELPGIFALDEYYQVFKNEGGFVPGLSVLDLIFNTGPDSINYLKNKLLI